MENARCIANGEEGTGEEGGKMERIDRINVRKGDLILHRKSIDDGWWRGTFIRVESSIGDFAYHTVVLNSREGREGQGQENKM